MKRVTPMHCQDLPVVSFHKGENYNAYDFMGAHFTEQDGAAGVVFRTWAPKADKVSVIGDFDNLNDNAFVMKRISDGGVWEVFVPHLKENENYKFAVKTGEKVTLKADPYAFYSETQGKTFSKVYNLEGYAWQDGEFIRSRTAPYDKPMNIYEVNLASWKRHSDGSYYTYKELKTELVQYVVNTGYTHVEFMPVAEYPFDGSWGYQVTGYYAVSSRFGTPKDFMALVDEFHKNGIAVIVDWVPAHFPKDEHGLFEFDGTPCYESQVFGLTEHKGWGTKIFDWGKSEVQSFLISNALFMFEKYHVDGLRVDAVASMIYLDYDRKTGEWMQNQNGGNYNLDAISFLQKLNSVVFAKFPYALMIAEESTSFRMVTRPTDVGGLGFNFKWNMGWMNDVLSYMQCDPYFRSGEHNKLTFSMCYAFSENYILPVSHDEVVYGKKSLIDKMHGDITSKFANLRAFIAYMFAHPGKKLSFMGNEFGQFKEWNYKEGLEFFLKDFENHKKLSHYCKTVNKIYKENAPLYQIEDSWQGFQWISPDERDNNVISFKRIDKTGKTIVFIVNFSGYTFEEYRLGLDSGNYKLLLSSDDKAFGGQGRVKKKLYKTAKKPAHGREYSVLIKLPAFTAIYLEKAE